MKLSEQQMIFTYNVAQLIEYIYANQYYATFGDAYRAPELAEIYAKQGKGIKDSLHSQRMAIDLNLFDKDKKYVTDKESYQRFGNYWKSLHKNNVWGGDWVKLVDSNHFEMKLD
jgi:hypothetical protein